MKLASPRVKDLGVLAGLTLAGFFLEGYHPAVEDAEIYLPGILKRLDPALFPYNSEFFQSHAHMTFFPQLIAGCVRATHLSVGTVLLGWQLLCIFLLLLGCWRIARRCFQEEYAVWCAVAFIAVLLRLSAAGTQLYLMDEYVTPRSMSMPGAVLAIADTLEGNYLRSTAWLLAIAVIHPLMALFAATFVVLLFFLQRQKGVTVFARPAIALPLFPEVTPAYREVLATRPYFFLTNWAWYEWLGLLAPFAILWWMARLGKRHNLGPMALLCKSLIFFEGAFFALALVISMPGRFENLAEIQPMRSLQLLYVLMFLLGGGLLGKFVLRKQVWRWAALFVPLCGLIVVAQRATFPATPYVEGPGRPSSNSWVQAFDWVRINTPKDAYFAMDPEAMRLPGEDQHGFRAVAQRSLLADSVKDSGAVSMFPTLAQEWKEQVTAQRGWKQFQRKDLEALKARYGVTWVVVEQPGVTGLLCPFENRRVRVCKVE